MKLDAPASPAPAAPTTEPADDAGYDGLGDTEPAAEPAPADDKPFDDEPFDAGVEADEDADPKKYIEQLTGKLGQSLRKYTESQGQPDFELEKFAINSLLSATHTSEMDEEDKKDIIKKVNTAGNDDSEGADMGDSNDNTDNTDDSNDGFGRGDNADSEFGGEQGEENLDELHIYENENLFLDEPKKNNMFQPGSNDVLNELKPCWKGYKQVGMKEKDGKEVPNCVPVNENHEGGESLNYMFWQNLKTTHNASGELLEMNSEQIDKNLINSEKNRIFDKNYLVNKLHETFNQDDMKNAEPQTAPAPVKTPVVKPGETKPVQPSRKNKPFLPMPEVQPDPKADNEGNTEV